jgi:hypothetical protein
MHVALRRPRSAQASNDRITFVSALDQRNKRGYDVLLFRPPAHTGQKARAVTLYEGRWHELDHNARTRRPYLGIEWLDIHEFDGESLPSDNEPIPESSDEEPRAPRPESEDSSDEEPTQRYAPNTQQEPPSPTASVSSYTYYGRGPRELPPPNEHRSSIATLSQEQQSPAADMATQTITTTAATTTIRPSTPPIDTTPTTQTSTSAPQRVASHLQTALRRAPGGPSGPGGTRNPGGPGGPEGPDGPGGPGQPGGDPPAPVAPAAPAQPANHDDRLMGSLPQAYEGDRKLARTFLDQLTHYF